MIFVREKYTRNALVIGSSYKHDKTIRHAKLVTYNYCLVNDSICIFIYAGDNNYFIDCELVS